MWLGPALQGFPLTREGVDPVTLLRKTVCVCTRRNFYCHQAAVEEPTERIFADPR